MTFGFLSDCYANNNDTDAKVIPIRPLSMFMIFTFRKLIYFCVGVFSASITIIALKNKLSCMFNHLYRSIGIVK